MRKKTSFVFEGKTVTCITSLHISFLFLTTQAECNLHSHRA